MRERMRDTLHRFVATITHLPWGSTTAEMEGVLQPPYWLSRGLMFVANEAANVFQDLAAAESLRADVKAICEATPKSPEDIQEAVNRAQATIDIAVAERPSMAERRLAIEVVANARDRFRFVDQDDSTNEASLVVGVAALELLMAELVRAFYVTYPDALKGLSRNLTAREVLDALERGYDLRERLLDEAVDTVIGRAPAIVRKWFEDQRPLDLNLDRNCLGSWDDFAEVFERRHTIVHSGAIVTEKYHAVVRGSPPIGSSLQVSSAYIVESFDRLLAFGITLLAEVWAKLSPTDALGVLVALVDLIEPVQHLWDRYHNPWRTLEVIADALVRIGDEATGADAEGIKVMTRLTKLWWAWQSAAALEGIHPQTTIGDWTAGPSAVEQFALAALRHDDDAAAALVNDATQSPAFTLLAVLPDGMNAVRAAAQRLRAK
jgi:hypothetical protein